MPGRSAANQPAATLKRSLRPAMAECMAAMIGAALGKLLDAEDLAFLLASFYEFAGLAVGPRVVRERELDAVRHGRVIVKQERIHGAGLGVAEVHVA